jgi:hypothetical protein
MPGEGSELGKKVKVTIVFNSSEDISLNAENSQYGNFHGFLTST